MGKEDNACSCSLIGKTKLFSPISVIKEAQVSRKQFKITPNVTLSHIDQICKKHKGSELIISCPMA